MTRLGIGAREGDAIRIGDDIEIVIVSANSRWVKVSISAPADVRIQRCSSPRPSRPKDEPSR